MPSDGAGGAQDAVLEAEQVLDALDHVRLVVHDQDGVALGSASLRSGRGVRVGISMDAAHYAKFRPPRRRGKRISIVRTC